MRLTFLTFILLSLWTVVSNAIEWKWIGDATTSVSDATEAFNSDGSPINLENISDRIDAELLDDFYAMVPEGVTVSNALLAGEFKNISIKESLAEGEVVTVKVTFLNEGAGYKNALGYFIYDTSNPPATTAEIEHILIMPNSSKTGSGGSLNTGDQIDLMVSLTAGESIGFFINSNGWDWSYGYQRSSFTFGQPFYTLTELNPAVGLGQRYHVIFNDTRSETEGGSGFFAFGFEDILTTGGDKDFNDLIFNVEVTPISAVDGFEDVISLPSVTAQVDIKTGVLAFEDNWPVTDDYDFNDAVLGYEITKTHDVDNESIKTIEIEYEIKAIGASFHNGIALRVPGLTEAMLESVSLEKTLNGVSNTISIGSQVTTKMANADEVTYTYPLIKDSDYADNFVSFTLSEDLFETLSTFDASSKVYETFGCMYQTLSGGLGCPGSTTAATLKLTIEINSGELGKEVIGDMPFDHYMFSTHKNDLYRYGRYNGAVNWFSSWQTFFSSSDAANGPGPGKYLEIHLKEFNSGTNVFEDQLSRSDYAGAVAVDAQPYDQGNPFISSEIVRKGKLTGNLPWVLDLPSDWKHPKERVDISIAYPNFYYWAEDNTSHSDWYESEINTNALFN